MLKQGRKPGEVGTERGCGGDETLTLNDFHVARGNYENDSTLLGLPPVSLGCLVDDRQDVPGHERQLVGVASGIIVKCLGFDWKEAHQGLVDRTDEVDSPFSKGST